MPIVETDPWRTQYFSGVACPDHVVIPTDDQLAYQQFPQHRWIYNKLLICETQGLDNAPHDILPRQFPVFSKPIYNMRGMGSGSKIVESPEQFRAAVQPGHMWMPLLGGEHVSTDAAVIDGEPVWWRHTIGKTIQQGMFDYWVILGESKPEIEGYCGDWLRRHLRGYTGCVNFETIGAKIIEATCASPISGPTSTVRVGSMRSSISMRAAVGIIAMRTAGPATVSCSSERMVPATKNPITPQSMNFSAGRAFPASR